MHSLTKILHSLLTGGQERAVKHMAEEEDSRKEVTSIRLKPQTRAWLQSQSETLGISVSQMINIMVDGVVSIETEPRKNQIDTMYDRLMLLFEIHGIAPLEMSRMLSKYGITLSKIKSRDATLDCITPELLADVSAWFGINQSWLSATNDDVYPQRSLGWYKNAEGMAVAIIERNILHGNLDIYVIKNDGVTFEQAEQQDDNAHYLGIGFLLKYKVTVCGVSFTRFEFGEFQRWNYVRCREDLKLVFRFIDQLSEMRGSIRLHGRTLEGNLYERIHAGRILSSQLETTLDRAAWWDPTESDGGVPSGYNKMKFKRFLDAYCARPHKLFTPVYTEYSRNPESWTVNIWNEGEEPLKYSCLTEALDDIYDRYHSVTNGRAVSGEPD